MKIWVDADACPVAVKEILFRVATRRQVDVTFVANQKIRMPSSVYLKSIQVSAGFDVADDEIVQQLDQGDLVITADIPLAADVLAKEAHALSPRGDMFSTETIKGLLMMRDFKDLLRGSGEFSGGPAAFAARDKQAFANQLDRFLTKYL
ncbi:MAG: YaiI/YqxD family protein [Mariprofundaceae bacterium]|nr:YaiI/YqxD family protein [Mariprofundaceae bacterium]